MIKFLTALYCIKYQKQITIIFIIMNIINYLMIANYYSYLNLSRMKLQRNTKLENAYCK